MDRGIKSGKRIIFTERSIYTDYNIFCKNLFEEGIISEIEMECYKLWFNLFKYPTTYKVYIKTNLDNCQKRIQLRNRQGEEGITEKYLKDLDNLHDKWLLEDNNNLLLDGNLNFKNNAIISEYMIQQINDKWNLHL
jgi:deoxyadenosine/deoxycytidine kinase